MRFPKPGRYPVHLHPLRGNIFQHGNPQTRPREHPSTRRRHRARVVSRRRLCTPFPSPLSLPVSLFPLAPHHKRRRRVLAGYTKLFKWDLLDGTLPNALPASSRSTTELQDSKPWGAHTLRGAIRLSTFDGMSIQTTHSMCTEALKIVGVDRA